MNEKQIRELVVSTARKWLGATRGDSRHKEIVDIYNAQKPLPVSYKVTYTDAWCATFVTTVGLQLGFSDIILPECGCIRMIDLYKKHTNSKWTEQDSFVPQLGDIVMYDWDDGTSFATNDNLGAVEHVGIVSDIQGNTITVIEGNYDNKVKERTLQVNGRFIRGYCLPAYNLKVSKEESAPEQTIPEQSKPEPAKPTGDNPSNWAKTSTDWAKTMELFLGDGQGNYDWQAPMTREMAAQILYNFYNKIGN